RPATARLRPGEGGQRGVEYFEGGQRGVEYFEGGSLVGVPVQAGVDDGGDGRREPAPGADLGCRVGLQGLAARHRRAGRQGHIGDVEGLGRGSGFVEHQADAPDVGRRPELAAGELFGRHVAGCAGTRGAVAWRTGQAQVDQAGDALAGDDVAGFDVEVQVAAAVQVAQRRAQLLAQVAQVRGAEFRGTPGPGPAAITVE